MKTFLKIQRTKNIFKPIKSQTDFSKGKFRSKGVSTQDEFWKETFEAEEVYKTRAMFEFYKQGLLKIELKTRKKQLESEQVLIKTSNLLTSHATLLSRFSRKSEKLKSQTQNDVSENLSADILRDISTCKINSIWNLN